MTNIQKHYENRHKEKRPVEEIISLKKEENFISDKDIRREIRKKITIQQTILKNKGDHQHNTLVLRNKRGELLLSR